MEDKLLKYMEEVKSDLKIDDLNIKDVQMRLPARKHFWVARLIGSKVDKNKMLVARKKRIKDMVEKILVESPVRLTHQSAEQMASKSPEIEAMDIKIKEIDMIIEYLEKVEKIFSTMHWEIRNIIQINEQERL